ncbi:hypothetical protein DRO48_01715 [Candidatus Bathyarchaeota archaeon]|nr:MAG: hypothetical protein DRO48_01715 [Candidatus Bathyarchaeota archaeon]
MRTALCHFCLKSGILCPECEKKLRRGEVTDTDIKIARMLLELEKDCPPLQNVYFHKAVEVDDALAIVVGRGDIARLHAYKGWLAKSLEKMTGKKVQIVEYDVDDRSFLEYLFSPLEILTINKIWLPDGSTETRVILKGGKKPPINLETLKKLAFKIRGMVLRVEFGGWP